MSDKHPAEVLANDVRHLLGNQSFTADKACNMLRRIPALEAERDALRDALSFVERWANHHATKPRVTPQEALSVIQHHPGIAAITKSYADGKVPQTPDPFAERDKLRAEVESLTAWRENMAAILGVPGAKDCTAPAAALELLTEVEALRADAERLDYIAGNARCDPKMDGHHVWWPTSFQHRLAGPNLRTAIDAARGAT